MIDKIAIGIPDVTIRGVRPCDVCMFYDTTTDAFNCNCGERKTIREFENIGFCRWNLTWDEFCQIYDPYIM